MKAKNTPAAARRGTAPVKTPTMPTHGGLPVAKGAARSTPADGYRPLGTRSGLAVPAEVAARSTTPVKVPVGFEPKTAAQRGTPSEN